jgi:hypothetical protein
VHVNNGFALTQNHGLDYLEIHQFRGVKILRDTSEFTYSFLPFIGDQPICIILWNFCYDLIYKI